MSAAKSKRIQESGPQENTRAMVRDFLSAHYSAKLKGQVSCVWDADKKQYCIQRESLHAVDYVSEVEAARLMEIIPPLPKRRILAVRVKRMYDEKATSATKHAWELIDIIARMQTEEEFGYDSPPSEDWIGTLNDLIAEARKIQKEQRREYAKI